MPQHTAQIIAFTQPKAGRSSCTTAAELLAFFARVSNAANQDNHATGPKLIKRLVRDAEWSPLDMVSITYEIKTSRRISRQILRHWSARFQEFSQRWATLDDVEPYYTVARLRDPSNRAQVLVASEFEQAQWLETQRLIWNAAYSEYQAALLRGQHPESACAILPEGMTPSTLYAQASVRTWLHYSLLRMKAQTQAEHRIIAEQVWDELLEEFPTMKGAFNENP